MSKDKNRKRNEFPLFPRQPFVSGAKRAPESGAAGRLPGTHRPGLEVLVRQAPLVPVVLVIHQVLLHDLVAGVKEQVADRTGGRVLQVAHWGGGEKRSRNQWLSQATLPSSAAS